MTVLSLCDRTGTWSAPYERAGYNVIRVDVQPSQVPGHVTADARQLEWIGLPVRGILAAPPCTMFANSGARWKRTDDQILDALSVVDACLRAVAIYRPAWWALENPVGKLSRWLGPPLMRFDPCDYGDPYTKRTCLWGDFRRPPKRRVRPVDGSKMHRLPPSPERANLRSVTPAGFAIAFYEANP